MAAGILTEWVVSASTLLLLLASDGDRLAVFSDSCWELPALAKTCSSPHLVAVLPLAHHVGCGVTNPPYAAVDHRGLTVGGKH